MAAKHANDLKENNLFTPQTTPYLSLTLFPLPSPQKANGFNTRNVGKLYPSGYVQ